MLGRYGTVKSPIASPPGLDYYAISLKDGEQWRYKPETRHTIAWVAVQAGRLNAGAPIEAGELAAFSESSDAIDFQAEGDSIFMLGSAIKHPHDLVLGSYSVHTSARTLREGERGIRKVAEKLKAGGLLG